MAKQTIAKGGTTKVRFIMLEAEGAEGDLAQIASAIQSALKPNTTVIQQRVISNAMPTPALPDAADEVEQFAEDDEADVEVAAKPIRTAGAAKPRKYPMPKVLDDVDLNTATAFHEFADQKAPDSDKDRFLVVAAWFHEHRSLNAINMNHVFTCYKKMRWPSGIADFAWPLRNLKKEGLMSSAGRGEYAINHIGLSRVEEMGQG